jgi:hypothetical protein
MNHRSPLAVIQSTDQSGRRRNDEADFFSVGCCRDHFDERRLWLLRMVLAQAATHSGGPGLPATLRPVRDGAGHLRHAGTGSALHAAAPVVIRQHPALPGNF